MPDDTSSSSGFGAALKKKIGPLPTWGWLLVLTAIALAYYLYSKNKSSKSTGTKTPTPSDVGQPGVVVINQDEGAEPPAPPEKKHHHHGRGAAGDESTKQITVSKDETLGELARQYHWSRDTLRDVENMNATAGQGSWTESTRLHKGQEVLRPLGG